MAPEAYSTSSKASRTVDDNDEEVSARVRSSSLNRLWTDGVSSTALRSLNGACSHHTAIGSVSCVPEVATAAVGYSGGSLNGWPGVCQ